MTEEAYGSGDPSDNDPENQKGTFEYWKRWIKAAEKAAKISWNDAEAAWEEYENTDRPLSRDRISDAVESGSRIYWSSCKIMEPALYSRTPKTVTEREFGANDLPALAACKIAEGLGKHHTGTSRVTNSRFDETMMSAVQEFIHAGRVANQIIYEKKMVPATVPVQMDEQGNHFTADGMLFEGEVKDIAGMMLGYTGEEEVDPESQRIYPVSLSYNKTLHSPAAINQYDITEKAIYFFLPKADAIERFGKDVCKKIQWKSRAESRDATEEQTNTEDYIGSFVEGWECYDYENKKVRWYSDQCSEFLDEQDDPDRYYDFWPTTDYIIQSKPHNSLYPTPVFTQLAPLIGQLHLLSERIYDLVDAIRPRALVDGDEDVVAALDTLDSSMYIATGNLKGIIEKGGLKNMVLFIPVRELVEALNTSIAIQQQFKQEFNELMGIPDVIRGITDPLEAEGTNAQNLTAAHDRFRYIKKQVATLASQTICKMIEISVQVYAPEKIAKIVGHQFWPEYLKPAFLEGLELLKDPEQGVVRIDVDTDSLTFKDQKREREEQRFISELVTSSLQNIAQMLQMDPSFASVSLNLLVDTLEKVGEGKYLSDEVKQAVDALIQKANQPPPPPPPDYEAMKLEIEKQKVEIENRKVVSGEQLKIMALEQKGVQTNLKSVELQIGAVLEQGKMQQTATKEMRQLAQEDIRIQIDGQRFLLEQSVQQFMMQIEAMTLEIKKMQAQVQSTETMMEELRLAKEVDNNHLIGLIQASKPTEGAEVPQTPPVNVNIIDAGTKGRGVL